MREVIKYTEKAVQNWLLRYLRKKGHKWSMPCFTPSTWWECDMWSVTSSDYWYEFEVKLSKADFEKDCLKQDKVKGKIRKKYDEIVAGNGPRAFYFVVPDTLLPDLVIPDWAGVLTFCKYGRRVSLKEHKKPRYLNKATVQESTIKQMLVASYYRFWDARSKNGL